MTEREIVQYDGIEFRYYGDELDEVVADDVRIHFECMGTGSWWMMLTTSDGTDYHVNLGVRRARPSRRSEIDDTKWQDKHLANWSHHEADI